MVLTIIGLLSLSLFSNFHDENSRNIVNAAALNSNNSFLMSNKQVSIQPTTGLQCVPNNTNYKDFIWSSSNPEIATVNETGFVAASTIGSTLITAKNKKTNAKISGIINVVDLTTGFPMVSTRIGKTEIIKLNKSNNLPTGITFNYFVENKKIVEVLKVNQFDLTIKGLSTGITKLWARSNEGNLFYVGSLKVMVPKVFVHGLMGDKTTFDKMISGMYYNVELKDNNSTIITVDKNGDVLIPDTLSPDVFHKTIFQIVFKDNTASFENQVIWLRKALLKVKEITGSDYVDLVGHSMGGVISAKYIVDSIKDNSYSVKVNRLVTLDSPILGASIAFLDQVKSYYGNCFKDEKPVTCLKVDPKHLNAADMDLLIGSSANSYLKQNLKKYFPSTIKVLSFAVPDVIVNGVNVGIVSESSAFGLTQFSKNVKPIRSPINTIHFTRSIPIVGFTGITINKYVIKAVDNFLLEN